MVEGKRQIFLMSDGQPPRVLIVDDQPANLEVVGPILGNLGCEIIVAADGPTALKRAELHPVDLILLDLNMPGMNGCEVCARLRETANREVPVIFLSASNEKDLVVQALDSGGVDYITKPFNQAELVSRVRTQLELKCTRDRLRQLAEDKDELIGILAHDLKSQLAGIQMTAQLLSERFQRDETTDRRAGKLADNLAHSSTELLAFVKGYLANAAADHGGSSLSLTAVDPGVLAAGVAGQYQAAARRKEITLVFENASANSMVLADCAALGQVLDNLISNAVKFSPPGKTIRVRLSPDAEAIEIRVQDEGPGFTEEDQAKMFRRYARLSARPTAGEPSSGLGLSIARKLVHGMNGELTCETRPGEGATFCVRLPLAKETG